MVFEPTGRYHRGLVRALAEAGLPAAAVNPWQARRFAEGETGRATGSSGRSNGRRAKTDRIDAGMLARLGALLAPAVRAAVSLAREELRELHAAREALIRDSTAAKNRAQGIEHPLLRRQADRRLKAIARDLAALGAAIAALIEGDGDLARAAAILRSIPGIAAAAAAILAEMPELGTLEPAEAASLAGLAPITRESGRWKGAARIGGGRAGLRRALYMPALTAARFNPDLRAVYDSLRAAGKPPKVALTAVMRKLLLLANALIRDDREWSPNAR